MTARESALMAARWASRVLPDSLLARLLPGELGWNPVDMHVATATATAPKSKVRVLIGPVNSAGQGFRWARAVEHHLPGVGAVSLMTTNSARAQFDFPVDVRVPESGFVFASGWQRRQRAAIEEQFTHVLLESGSFAYGSVPGRDPIDIAKELSARGPRIALLWHGSDIRLPSAHAEIEPDSPFGVTGKYPAGPTAILEANARRRMRFVTDTDFPVFVSTPGLLSVPRSQWLPVVVDVEQWESEEAPLRRRVPVVAYVPSNSPMKGDASIDEQLIALADEGIISYRRLEGIPARQMPEVYRSADIVLDQFRLGDYGVAACEALAAGRVVIGHVSAQNRERVLSLTGYDLPIVESRFVDVAKTIRAILEDREWYALHAQHGPAFVRSVHDGAASAQAVAGFLGAETRE